MDTTIGRTRPYDTASIADLLEVFLASREAEGLEPVTIANYRSVAERFLACPSVPATPGELTDDHLVRWLAWLRRGGLADGTVAYHQRHLWVFLRWLKDRDVADPRLMRTVRRVRVQQHEMPTVTLTVFMRILTVLKDPRPRGHGAAGSREHERRNIAIAHVLFFCGLRASEMVALDYPRDIDLARRELTVAHAKGKKWRRVPFDVKTKAALTEYIALERGKDPGPLFLSRGGSRVTYNALKMLMRRLEERCGAEITAHAFRRGFADKVLEQGVDPISTANLLGHSGLEMVRHYAKAGESRRAIASYRERVG